MCKRSISVSIFVFVLALLVTTNVFAANFSFERNLRLGDTGADVFELQKLLNEDSSTAVSLDGPGSKGNETYYFGEKTQLAVISFQNKYAADILTPQGLFSGTGFVGASTRTKLNILENTPVSEVSGSVPVEGVPNSIPIAFVPVQQQSQNTSGFSTFNFFADSDKTVQLVFVSANSGKHGSTLELTGNNFSLTDNKIYFGANVMSGVPAVNKNKIVLTIPSSVPVGVYDVEVSNSAGKSESNTYFVVTSDTATTATLPKIISVSPANLSLGDQVIVTGENFTSAGNQVRTSLGAIENVSSADGKTLKFDINAPSDLEVEKVFRSDNKFELPVYIYVVNTNGVSDRLNPGIITLKGI